MTVVMTTVMAAAVAVGVSSRSRPNSRLLSLNSLPRRRSSSVVDWPCSSSSAPPALISAAKGKKVIATKPPAHKGTASDNIELDISASSHKPAGCHSSSACPQMSSYKQICPDNPKHTFQWPKKCSTLDCPCDPWICCSFQLEKYQFLSFLTQLLYSFVVLIGLTNSENVPIINVLNFEGFWRSEKKYRMGDMMCVPSFKEWSVTQRNSSSLMYVSVECCTAVYIINPSSK